MLKIFSMLFRPALTDEAQWNGDLLSHPALRGMDQRQLADLPLRPARLCEEEQASRDDDLRLYA